MRTIHITHNDMDGHGCSLLLKVADSEIDQTIFVDKPSELPQVLDGVEDKEHTALILTDLNVTPQSVPIIEEFNGFWIVDHHVTEPEIVRRLKENAPQCVFDTSACATALLYKYLDLSGYYYDAPIKEIVEAIDKRDRFTDPYSPLADKLQYLFKILAKEGKSFVDHVSEHLEYLGANCLKYLFQGYEARIEKCIAGREKNITDALAIAFEVGNAVVTIATKDISDIGYRICDGNTKVAIIINPAYGGSLAFRSGVNGPDVSEIAKRIGGGGHEHAAGAKLPEGWLRNIEASVKELLDN